MFRRLVWKEYRLQWPLWIAMAALTILIELLLYWGLPPGDRPLSIFCAAGGLPAFYLLGCGAMLFAGEHESGVYEFQRSLPVRAATVFFAKMAFSAVAAMAMFALMNLLAFALTGWTLHPPGDFSPVRVLLVLDFFGVELFLWAVLFSLKTRGVVAAALLGVTAASFSLQVMSPRAIDPNDWTSRYWPAMPCRMVFAAVLALLVVRFGARWFRERRARVRHPVHGLSPMAAVTAAPGVSAWCSKPDRTVMLARLVWLHWRQAWRLMALVVACTAPFVVVGILNVRHDAVGPFVLALAPLPLLGVCAFLHDQKGHGFRFLADHGVPPKYVWLSRQLMVLLPALLLLLLLLSSAVFLLSRGAFDHVAQRDVRMAVTILFYVFGYVVLAIGVGQMASMVFRSGILAGVCSILAALPLALWWALMLFWHVPWWWSVLPIPLAMFLATRLRVHGWLVERNTFRAWLPPILALAIPAVALVVAVPLYRIYEIPSVQIDRQRLIAEFDRPPTAEEQATMRLYEQAWQHSVSPWSYTTDRTDYGAPWPRYVKADNGRKIDLLDANRQAVRLALEASRGKTFDPKGRAPWFSLARSLSPALMQSAEALEADGKLDEALERYLAVVRMALECRRWSQVWGNDWCADRLERDAYERLAVWAARPKQTRERILAARRQIEQLTSHLSLDDAVRLEYSVLYRTIRGAPDFLVLGQNGQATLPWLAALWLRLPWERERALRLLDVEVSRDLNRVWTYCCSTRWELLDVMRECLHLEPISEDCLPADAWWWNQRTLTDRFKAMQTARAAVRLVLTLEAWKVEHGALPKTLQEMVGPDLPELPIDPYANEPFVYFPDGVKTPLRWQQPSINWSSQGAHCCIANVPLIWSAGANISVGTHPNAEILGGSIPKYSIRSSRPDESSPHPSYRSPRSEHDVWESGWPFAIP
jgi:hypothetical protein